MPNATKIKRLMSSIQDHLVQNGARSANAPHAPHESRLWIWSDAHSVEGPNGEGPRWIGLSHLLMNTTTVRPRFENRFALSTQLKMTIHMQHTF